jgi:hypothetical protein
MNLSQFLELFRPLPGNCYLQVSTKEDVITKALTKLLKNVDGELRTAFYNEKNLNFTKPFRALPRDHDIVILQDVLSQHEMPKILLKNAYTTLANTADIILLEKKDAMEIEEMKALLEEFEFRAINDISILDGYNLVMGKKMHMWGNGL